MPEGVGAGGKELKSVAKRVLPIQMRAALFNVKFEAARDLVRLHYHDTADISSDPATEAPDNPGQAEGTAFGIPRLEPERSLIVLIIRAVYVGGAGLCLWYF